MKSLVSYIMRKDVVIDGHIHLFNWEESIVGKIPHGNNPNTKMVGFMDIEFDNIEKYNTLRLYDEFIKNHYDPDFHILLATGTNIEDISEVYNKHKDIIRGFGELKCYDQYQGIPINYKKISLVRDVVKFSSKNGNLPVYVHWELNEKSDVVKFEKVLKDFPGVPIVLCHCGINEKYSEYAYSAAQKLSRMYGNLWLDISYVAINFFYEKPWLLLQLPSDRIFIGSDLNNKSYGPNHNFDKDYKNMTDKLLLIDKYISRNSSTLNLKKLFKES
jgi:hypothetical protein